MEHNEEIIECIESIKAGRENPQQEIKTTEQKVDEKRNEGR